MKPMWILSNLLILSLGVIGCGNRDADDPADDRVFDVKLNKQRTSDKPDLVREARNAIFGQSGDVMRQGSATDSPEGIDRKLNAIYRDGDPAPLNTRNVVLYSAATAGLIGALIQQYYRYKPPMPKGAWEMGRSAGGAFALSAICAGGLVFLHVTSKPNPAKARAEQPMPYIERAYFIDPRLLNSPALNRSPLPGVIEPESEEKKAK